VRAWAAVVATGEKAAVTTTVEAVATAVAAASAQAQRRRMPLQATTRSSLRLGAHVSSGLVPFRISVKAHTLHCMPVVLLVGMYRLTCAGELHRPLRYEQPADVVPLHASAVRGNCVYH
jgi:hypothetical protein